MDGSLLIVEDDDDVGELLAEMLRTDGYDAVRVNNAREGLTYLEANPNVRLVFLDMATPEMDGWEFCRRRSVVPQLREVPVVAITAVARVREQARELGLSAVVGKPLILERMVAIAEKHCRR